MIRLRGIELVSANLNKEILKIKGASLKGLIEASIIIRRSMATTSPIVPVDTRNLEASWFVVTALSKKEGATASFKGKESSKLSRGHGEVIGESQGMAVSKQMPFVVMGFSAYYATFVHEMVGASFQRPGAGAKFLEAAINRNKSIILATIKKNVRIK